MKKTICLLSVIFFALGCSTTTSPNASDRIETGYSKKAVDVENNTSRYFKPEDIGKNNQVPNSTKEKESPKQRSGFSKQML